MGNLPQITQMVDGRAKTKGTPRSVLLAVKADGQGSPRVCEDASGL